MEGGSPAGRASFCSRNELDQSGRVLEFLQFPTRREDAVRFLFAVTRFDP